MFFNLSPSKQLKIKSRKKNFSRAIDLSTRVISEEETLTKLIPICRQIGVSRVSDITYLDRLYIPNYSAILPGTEDSIWVYSGKGPTKLHAKVSALMEAVERYSSLPNSFSKRSIQGSYSQLSRTYNKVLHPNEVLEPQRELFDVESSVLDYLPGIDLLRNEDVLVPTQLVLSRYSPAPPAICAFQYSHTNGLAAGNVLEEAICHAICEVIERDAVSIADLCTSAIPYTILEEISTSLKSEEHGSYSDRHIFEHFVDDSCVFMDVDVSEIEEVEPLKFLLRRFEQSGIPLLIKNITMKDIGVPTFIASSYEWLAHDYGLFARGYGSHPDARVAMLRALTELSQTRAANIQGARDDLTRITYRHNNDYSKRWQFVPTRPGLSRPLRTLKFSEIKTYVYDDVLSDIKIILKSLKKAGIKRVIVVELTNTDIGISVVRAIIPGLETFEVQKLFKGNALLYGRRAKVYFSEMMKLADRS